MKKKTRTTKISPETFQCEHDYIELCDLLKVAGPRVSGGEAKQRIRDAQVLVDGQVELRKKCKIRPGQTVSCGGLEILVK